MDEQVASHYKQVIFNFSSLMLLRSMRKLRNDYCSYHYYKRPRYVQNLGISSSELVPVVAGKFLTSIVMRI
jgi:hypothetical protein